MFVKLRRVLPEGKEVDVAVNSDQIVWVQSDNNDTVTIFPATGPELVVKKSNATDALVDDQKKT